MSKLCEGRTVIITGAGGGLGRAHALAFGAAGANVIINDINAETAAETAQMIEQAGGVAQVDNFDITDYAGSAEAVERAVEKFGALHIVLNNAGNNRDRMFTSLSEADWDAVIAVHLKGHFCLSQHAARYWRELAKEGNNIAGRILNTTSGAGLQGSVGQSNYGAAKAGIATLTLIQAAELGRYGVTANAIAPVARTGMTMGVPAMAEAMAPPSDGSFDQYAPENVSPLLVWLASEEAGHVTGKVFDVGCGKFSIANGWHETQGAAKLATWTPEEVGAAMQQLLDNETPPQKVWGT